MNEIEYKIKKSKKAKSIRLTISQDMSVVLTLPWFVPKYIGKRFVESKKDWIFDKIKKSKNKLGGKRIRTRNDYLEHKESARILIFERLLYFNKFYNFCYNRISIRDQKTRWGSCSSKGNLNFSYKLLFLPDDLRDYVVVHELCHLREMNHSKEFWQLVSKIIPDYKALRKELKNNISV